MELSRLERLDDLFIRTISRVVWRRPHKRILKMFEFSFTEEDSFRDMARAAELTPTTDMRAKYLLHALDEARHAELFRGRARALIVKLEADGQATAPVRRALEKVLAPVKLHESYHRNTLFESLGELEFLAFVYVAERRGAQQFRIYKDLIQGDDESVTMFNRIMNDEKFHMSYSRAALDRYSKEGRSGEVRRALLRVRSRRIWQAWLRFCRRFADVSNAITFGIIYFGMVGPLSLFNRAPAKAPGWDAPEETSMPDLSAAQRQF